VMGDFFGSKQQLFLAAIGLPVNPAEILPRVLAAGDPAAVTERAASELAAVLEQPELVQRVAAMLRAAATEPDMARLLRAFFPDQLLGPLAGRLGPGDPRVRLNLFGTQIIGLLMGRAVIEMEPLASIPPRAVAELVAPTLVRYLIGPLDPDRA
jgi:Tetracyclin repressor-like, C-terminal domain